MGVTALTAAVVAARQPAPVRWAGGLVVELAVAVAICSGRRPFKRRALPRAKSLSAAGRKFVLSFFRR